MRIFRFDAAVARPITEFGSVGASIAPVARPGAGFVQLGCIYVAAGGCVGRHPAGEPQLFLVVAGEGWVSGADGERVPIRTGQAAFWEPGEEHESGSEQGMAVMVLEAEALDPARYMAEERVRP
ncbi:MAG TPA: cupin domain-containing protein [Ktedonobacterales bacterium]